jgi:integrase
MALGKIKKTQLDGYYQCPQTKKLQLSDGGNLYVIVTEIGSCIFKYRVRIGDKISWLTLGDFPTLSLYDARQKALETRKQIAQGIDPTLAKNDIKNKKITLTEFANLYIKERLPIIRKQGDSSTRLILVINNHILPIIGKYHLADLKDEKIRHLIQKKTDQQKHSMARIIRNALKSILDYAVERQIIAENPVNTKKAYNIKKNNSRQRYLNNNELQEMMKIIYHSDCVNIKYAIALHLLLLLLMRKTELIHAKWDQLDFEQEIFTITDDCKTGNALHIGLPTQAIKLFKILKELSGDSEFIFPSTSTSNKPIHENNMNKISAIINHIMFGSNKDKYFSIHDLRRTGRTHLGSHLKTRYPSDYIEEAMNHAKPTIVKTYQIGGCYFNERKTMLQDWADVIDGLIGEELLPYNQLNFL